MILTETDVAPGVAQGVDGGEGPVCRRPGAGDSRVGGEICRREAEPRRALREQHSHHSHHDAQHYLFNTATIGRTRYFTIDSPALPRGPRELTQND